LGKEELDMALSYLPGDAACHRALGHKEAHGFWGNEQDVALVGRMRAILTAADDIRERSFEIKELADADLPIELSQTGMKFYGARSEHYTYWTVDSFAVASACAQASERCHALLTHLLGDQAAAVRGDAFRWHVVLRTEEQRDNLFIKSPSTMGPFKLDQARLFAGMGFTAQAGGRASATWHVPGLDMDHCVANVTKRHFLDLRNDGFGEGLVHVTTWLLCDSARTYFSDLPKTVASGQKPLDRDPVKWFERLYKEIDEGRDQPLAVVPRERSDNFRDSTRVKSWSFMFWVMARYPGKWLPLIDLVSVPKLTVEAAEAAFEQALGQPVAAIEKEWRRWARRDSPLGKASGWLPAQ
jgi:hypothetical protein